ncbi:hypothetical protein MMC25_006668 [Agyrium rufum]|nr:hypothetical protein [Agyrium rufum]
MAFFALWTTALYLVISFLCINSSQAQRYGNVSAPTVQVTNGTYVGRYLGGQWDQDLFLGMPYAQPPTGNLRFRWPQSLNTSFTGTRDASQYGYSCYQYGTAFNLSEDCLNVNVIRPHGYANQTLPVLIWIFGGGLYTGSTADPQYNLSGIVRASQDSGEPFIAASMDYRLGMWGFLQTPQLLVEGSSNAGLLDQRLALRWIHENIAAFGGDPTRVTVWGESAGAQSIGLHLHSYGGRDDGLFQQAIMESGGPIGTSLQPLAYYSSPVENLTRTVGCYTSKDQLACLRSLSSEDYFKAQTSTTWNPIVDGDFLTAYPSTLMANGTFIHIPLLIGANSDEGISFGVKGLNDSTAIFNNLLIYRSYAISPPTARTLLDLYPNDPANEPPYYIKDNTTFPKNGLQWRRDCAIAGDIVIIGQRRKTCEEYVKGGETVYSYRFDTPLWNASVTDGVKHFVNVVFSFQNISGALGPLPQYQSYKDLSVSIGKAYTGFVNYGDPNRGAGGQTGLPMWPEYGTGQPRNMVLNSNGSFVEADDFRQEGIAFINSVSRELLA